MNYQLSISRKGEPKPHQPLWLAINSDIAAARRGGRNGWQSLKETVEKKRSDLFTKFPLILIEDSATGNGPTKTQTGESALHIDWVCRLQQQVSEEIFQLRQKRVFPLIISGDHSSVIGIVAGITKANPGERVGIVYIDAHADLHSPYTSPSGNIHGMSLAAVCGLDHRDLAVNQPDPATLAQWDRLKSLTSPGARIQPHDVVFCAVRDCEWQETAVIRQYGIRNYEVNTVQQNGAAAVAQRILNDLADCSQIYVSFDIDSLDADTAPGTGTPVKGGLTAQLGIELSRCLIRDTRVCCFELAEFNPLRDCADVTLSLAHRLLEGVTADLLAFY